MLRLHMILIKTSTKTDKSSSSQERLISLSPNLIFGTTPFYFVTYCLFCNLIGLQYTLQREQLDVDQNLSARACGYARLYYSRYMYLQRGVHGTGVYNTKLCNTLIYRHRYRCINLQCYQGVSITVQPLVIYACT